MCQSFLAHALLQKKNPKKIFFASWQLKNLWYNVDIRSKWERKRERKWLSRFSTLVGLRLTTCRLLALLVFLTCFRQSRIPLLQTLCDLRLRATEWWSTLLRSENICTVLTLQDSYAKLGSTQRKRNDHPSTEYRSPPCCSSWIFGYICTASWRRYSSVQYRWYHVPYPWWWHDSLSVNPWHVRTYAKCGPPFSS